MIFTVAVTRPEPQASETAQRLRARGDTVVKAPLMEAVAHDGFGTADGIGTLALTSRTAARLLAGAPSFHHLPVLCVGDATRREALAAGATRVTSVDGDVDDLLGALLGGTAEPIVHLSGADQRGDLTGKLTAAGLRAERRVIYAMRPVSALPACNEPLDAVLLYSPRTAAIYARLATLPPWRSAPCVALSAAVSDALPEPGAAAIAKAPTEAALLEALDRLRAGARA
ncbi:uroporphyrinogen-III synthase [Acuticoccus sp. MNP-M23]|uniref:uroporphyrinogen-III synthase n=1 Tax=Acuticoccus sp. MNP-M23 TaxID=3072793 RepID=UPI0028150B62|nr:uroporphyrinogen-III synthase [Acuticoccus sp. MNP-M23]WMS41548.1 uroporphyrinogen-III synthase [Acuticoccus sp. MNP-M23]